MRAYDTDFSYTTQSITGVTTNGATTTYNSSGQTNYLHYKRTRSGVGFKLLKDAFRVSAEYLTGTGMIFLGAHKESFDMNQPSSIALDNGDGLLGKADGWYIESGWRIPNTKFELDARYDMYNRLKGDAMEVNFSTMTAGAQYFMSKKSRLTVNYAFRRASFRMNNTNTENNLTGLGGRIAAQITAIY